MTMLVPQPARSTFSPTVLVVHDHFPNIRWLRKTLESDGCNLAVATNRIEALHLTQQIGFDAVIIDLTAAETSPFELIHDLRADKGQRASIVLMTSALMGASRAARADLEGLELLPKPVDPARLTGVIRYLTRGHAPSSSHDLRNDVR